MSSPPNPLDVFRTYSYHHILIACDSSTTAESLLDESRITLFQHPEDKFCPKTAPDNIGQYIVLINGMTDTQFSITSAKWSSVLIPRSPGVGQADASTTMTVDGEIEIVEPQGAAFYNLLNEATKMLGINPTSIIFLLKTVFAGTTDEGVTDMITTIRPLQFIMVDITSKFDTTGSVYNISLVGVVNGASKLPQANAIVNGAGFRITRNASVFEALKQFEEQLNAYYKDRKSSVIAAAKACGNSQVDFEKEFMDVVYHIEPDPAFKQYSAGTQIPPRYQETGSNDPYVVNMGENPSVDSIINQIISSSAEWQRNITAEAGTNEKTSNKYSYKIASAVKVIRENENKPTYHVYFYVHRYKGVVIPAEVLETWEPEDDQGIVFDYIFTGKNIDIIDFDIQMNYGLTYFQMLGAHQSSSVSQRDIINFNNPDAIVSGTGNVDGPGDQKPPDAFCGGNNQSKVLKPLFLGSIMRHPAFRDVRSPAAAAGFNALLHRIAALENIGAKIKIRGNPQLLEDTTQHPDDVSFLQNTPPLVPNSERDIMSSIHTIPGFVKVNVWLPNSWRTVGDDEQLISQAAGDYASNFWYKGWYYLLEIAHEFSDGAFTQTLEVYSLPTDAGQDNIGSCFDKKTTDWSWKRTTPNPQNVTNSDQKYENKTIADATKPPTKEK